MARLDDQGWWWPVDPQTVLPVLGEAATRPKDALPGHVQVDDDGRAQLEVFGAPTDPFSSVEPTPAAIWGQTIGGTAVSVLLPRLRASSGALGGASRETWTAALVIVGVHIREEADLVVRDATFELHGLREWLTDFWPGPDEAWPLRPREPRPPTRSHEPSRRRHRRQATVRSRHRARQVARTRELLARLSWQLDERRTVRGRFPTATVSLQMVERRSTSRFHDETEIRGMGHLNSETLIDLPTLESEWLDPLTNMLAVHTRRASVVRRLTVRLRKPVPAFVRPAVGPRTRYLTHDVEILRRRPTPGPDPALDGTMPFPAAAAGSQRDQLLPRWFDLHRDIGRSGTFLFGTLQGRDQWLENQLLNLVSFAEAYHALFYDYPVFDEQLNQRHMREALKRVPEEMRQTWRDKLTWAARLTQRERLRELVERATYVIPQLEPHVGTLVPQLTQTRNYLAHWGEPRSHVVEGTALATAIDRLLIVLRCDLLDRMEINHCCIQHAVLRGDHHVGALAN